MERKDIPCIPTPFINLQSDFGFKRVFGSEQFKKCLLQFLNAVLGDEMQVTEVTFHDKEALPADEDGKRIIYDVYCTMKVPPETSSFKLHHLSREDKEKEVEHHFILEMQNLYEPPFEDRMLYYTSRIISSQGKSGWNYDLDPVISMTVTDFDFSFLTPRIVQDFRITERTTGEMLTGKFRMLFFSLKQVPDEWEKCKNEVERLLYLIKNMETLDKNTTPYKEGGYEDLFDAAESSLLAAEDVVPYSRSLSRLRCYKAGVEYTAERAVEKEKESTARSLIMKKFDDDFIAEITGLSSEKIQEIRNNLK